MDVDMAATPTPVVRSDIYVPRPGATPAPRTAAAIVPATAPDSGPRPVPPSSAPVTVPQRSRCPLSRRTHRLQHCGIFRDMQPSNVSRLPKLTGTTSIFWLRSTRLRSVRPLRFGNCATTRPKPQIASEEPSGSPQKTRSSTSIQTEATGGINAASAAQAKIPPLHWPQQRCCHAATTTAVSRLEFA
nr:uncharacterized protein LOC118682480 [Bactrocera oleae]